LHIEYEDIEEDANKCAERVISFLSEDKNEAPITEDKVLSVPGKNSSELYQELKKKLFGLHNRKNI
jgi:hypothetical protein